MAKKSFKELFRGLLIPTIYFVIGMAWIHFSDNLLFELADLFNLTEAEIALYGKWKGFFYVTITAALLFFLIRARTRSLVAAKNDFVRLFEESPHPMWIYNFSNLKILLVNNKACEMYGYSESEFLDMTLDELYATQEKNRFQQMVTTVIKGYFEGGEWIHKAKDGATFYVNTYSHDTVYENQDCRIVTTVNINKRVLAEVERGNLQEALHNAALVVVFDKEGNVRDVNDNFCEVSGYSKEEVINEHRKVFNVYESRELWADMWENLQRKQLWRSDVQLFTKEGEPFWIDVVINPIFNREQQIKEFISIGYEITDKKRLQEGQKKLLDDFSEYAYLTSHKLRGPLSTMLGLISIFKEYPDQSYLIEKIEETSVKMDQVIRQMNDRLSRNAYEQMSKKRDAERKVEEKEKVE